jgi:hypothetical protein
VKSVRSERTVWLHVSSRTTFSAVLRERTYITNVTSKTRQWYESAWKAFTAAQKDAPERGNADPLMRKSDLQHFVVRLRERGVKPTFEGCG